jgi:hypothetical protein
MFLNVRLLITYPPSSLGQECRSCPQRSNDECRLHERQENKAGAPGYRAWEVGDRFRTTDQRARAWTEYTSAAPKVGPITRAEPPFTVHELKAIVGSPRWQPTVTVDVAQQDADLFTPKPDTTRAAVPSSTDDATPESYAPPSG